ncbi:MAG: hypothetical protein ACHREM_04525 [Polyangiales bacterium]
MNHPQDARVAPVVSADDAAPNRTRAALGRVARRCLAVAALAGLAAVGTGCVARVGPGPGYAEGEVVYEDEGGYEYDSYPSYAYGGTTVYLVGDRWYYRDGGRWGYYRTEPAGLYGYRQQYWSGHGHPVGVYGAAPGYRGRYIAPGHPGFSRPVARPSGPVRRSGPRVDRRR